MSVRPVEDFVRMAKPDPRSRYEMGVYDGDTVDMIVDLGYSQYTRQRFRVIEVDTPNYAGQNANRGYFSANWCVRGCGKRYNSI